MHGSIPAARKTPTNATSALVTTSDQLANGAHFNQVLGGLNFLLQMELGKQPRRRLRPDSGRPVLQPTSSIAFPITAVRHAWTAFSWLQSKLLANGGMLTMLGFALTQCC